MNFMLRKRPAKISNGGAFVVFRVENSDSPHELEQNPF